MLDQLKFPFPMFLTTWHMFLAVILTQIMSRTTKMLPGVTEVGYVLSVIGETPAHLTVLWCSQGKVDREVMLKQILPVALFFAVSLVFSNKAYIYLSVSYIQVGVLRCDCLHVCLSLPMPCRC